MTEYFCDALLELVQTHPQRYGSDQIHRTRPSKRGFDSKRSSPLKTSFDVNNLKKIRNSDLTVQELVSTAWDSARTFRGFDLRGELMS